MKPNLHKPAVRRTSSPRNRSPGNKPVRTTRSSRLSPVRACWATGATPQKAYTRRSERDPHEAVLSRPNAARKIRPIAREGLGQTSGREVR